MLDTQCAAIQATALGTRPTASATETATHEATAVPTLLIYVKTVSDSYKWNNHFFKNEGGWLEAPKRKET